MHSSKLKIRTKFFRKEKTMAGKDMFRGIRKLTQVWGPMLLVFSLFGAFSGCQEPQATTTYSKDVVIWPIYDLHRSEGLTADGVKWQKEKGDCVLLGYWDKEKKYDKDGFLIYRKEKSLFVPFASSSVEEDQKSITKEGAFLFFPNKTYRDKTASPK
jgi:hypothetical protein